MAKNRYWVQRNGTKILIKDMDDSHILNSIKLFEKTGKRKEQIEWLREERNKRLGIVEEEPVKNRWSILNIRED